MGFNRQDSRRRRRCARCRCFIHASRKSAYCKRHNSLRRAELRAHHRVSAVADEHEAESGRVLVLLRQFFGTSIT